MAFKTKRLIKKAVSWAGLFFFVIAAYMLYLQLSKYSWEDIKAALFSIPARNLWLGLHRVVFGICGVVVL